MNLKKWVSSFVVTLIGLQSIYAVAAAPLPPVDSPWGFQKGPIASFAYDPSLRGPSEKVQDFSSTVLFFSTLDHSSISQLQISMAGLTQMPQAQGAIPPKTPVWKKWWFWTAIGGAVVVTGVALGVGLHYGLKETPNPVIELTF